MKAKNTQNDISTVEIQEIQKSKKGRKKQYEDREKLTLYISKELANDIECISRVKNISKSNYAVSILEEEINKKKSTIEQIRKIQQEL